MGFFKSWLTGSWLTDPVKKCLSSAKNSPASAAPSPPAPPVPFEPSKKIPVLISAVDKKAEVSPYFSYLEIDDKRGLINIPIVKEILKSNAEHGIFNIRESAQLLDFELLDSGHKVADGASIGGAIVGGALFGAAGGIVGSLSADKKIKDYCSMLAIRLVFDDIERSTEYIRFIDSDPWAATAHNVRRGTAAYNEIYAAAQECVSVLTVLLRRNQRTK